MSFGGGALLGSAEGHINIDVEKAIRSLDALESRVNGLNNVGAGALGGLNTAGQNVDTLSNRAERVSKQYHNAGLAMAGFGAATTLALGGAVMTAANFEAAMDNVGASLGGVGENLAVSEEAFKALNQEALKIGQETAFSASEAAAAMDELAKAGQSAEDILGGSARASVDLAAAIGVNIPDAAAAVARAMNVWTRDGLTAAQAADTLTAAVNGSATDLPDLSAGLRNIGPIAANLGIPFNEAAAAVAYFTNFGLKGADAGVSLARGLENLAVPTSEASQLMADLGIEAFGTNGKFIGFPALMDQLSTSMGGMNDETKLAALSMIFGAEAADVMGIGILEGGTALNQMEEDLKSTGQAQEQARQRMDNFMGSLEQLKGSLETAAILMGTHLLPILRPIVDGLTKVVNAFSSLPGPVQGAMAAIVGVAGIMAGIAGVAVLMGPQILKTGEQFMRMGRAMLGLPKAIRAVSMALRGLMLANPWLLAIAAAIALLYLAYKTNFLGFGNGVRKVAGWVKDAFERIAGVVSSFVDLWKSASDPGELKIVAFLEELGDKFDSVFGTNISGYFDSFAGAIQRLSDWLGGLLDTFNRLTSVGINPVAAALQTISSAFDGLATGIAPIDAILQTASDAFQDLAQAVQAFVNGDWRKGFSELGQMAVNVLQQFGNFATLLRLLWEAVTSIDWGSVISSAVDIGGTLIDKGRDLIGGLWTGISERWPGVVSWLGGLATTIGSLVKSMASSLLDKGREFIGGLWNGINERWPELVKWLQGLPGTIAGLVGGMASALLERGRELISGIRAGIDERWTSLVKWLGGLGDTIAGLVPDFASKLWRKGWDLLQGLAEGIQEAWDGMVLPWLKNLGEFVLGLVPDLLGTLLDKGKDLFAGFVEGIGAGWTLVTGWFADNLPGADTLTGLIPDLSGIPNPLQTIIGWFETAASAIGTAWEKVSGFISGIGGAVGLGGGDDEGGGQNLSGESATASIASGLADQMEEAARRINSAITGIQASFIRLNYDLTFLPSKWSKYGTDAGEAFQEAVEGKFDDFETDTATSLDTVEEDLGTFVAQAGALGQAAGSAFQQKLAEGYIRANQSTQVTVNLMQSKLGTFATQARTSGATAGSGFASGMGAGMNNAASATQSAINRIRTALSSVGSQYGNGRSIGSSLGEGIAAGISSWAGRIASAAAAVVSSGIAAARTAAASASPSRKMIDLGRDLGAGLRIGLNQSRPGVMDAFGDLVPTGGGSRAIFNGMAAPGTGGTSVGGNITIITLEPGRWQEFLAAANMGAEFARAFPAEMAMSRR